MMIMMIIMVIRHEVPVSGEQIEVISMEDDLVVVSNVNLISSDNIFGDCDEGDDDFDDFGDNQHGRRPCCGEQL